jgi:hypothetical protein
LSLFVGARFLATLPGFLKKPLTLDAARAIVRGRLARRAEAFLQLAERAIYANPASPYRALLRAAGCEHGDLASLVGREGLEGALRTLVGKGVYLTVEEYKGRRPVERGGLSVMAGAAALWNPGATLRIPGSTSGSRGAGTPLLFDFAFVRDCAAAYRLYLDARGGDSWDKAVWNPPGGGALYRILKLAALGSPPVKWFSQTDPADPGLHARYRWSARALRWGGGLAGVTLPPPEHVQVDDPLPIVRWMKATLEAGRTPYLRSFSSSCIRVCQTAAAAGIDLEGAKFLLSGEPVTAARLAEIRAVGADAWPRYGTMETGPVGYGCLAPASPDDVHLVSDLHAVIHADGLPPGAGAPGTLFLTALSPASPLVLFNVSLGDQAMIAARACGCPLESIGWTTHLHTIRSAEKLTSEGMNVFDIDVIPLLEEVLPRQFGGAPTHYQIVEEEGHDGRSRLRLLVDPVVGPVDVEAVRRVFLERLGAGSGAERLMGRIWQDAGLLTVERRAPFTTASGKVLHLHVSAPPRPGARP